MLVKSISMEKLKQKSPSMARQIQQLLTQIQQLLSTTIMVMEVSTTAMETTTIILNRSSTRSANKSRTGAWISLLVGSNEFTTDIRILQSSLKNIQELLVNHKHAQSSVLLRNTSVHCLTSIRELSLTKIPTFESPMPIGKNQLQPH